MCTCDAFSQFVNNADNSSVWLATIQGEMFEAGTEGKYLLSFQAASWFKHDLTIPDTGHWNEFSHIVQNNVLSLCDLT